MGIAVAHGNREMVRTILATRKVDINRRYKMNSTILQLACMNKQSASCIRLLLMYPGIDVNAVDDNGNTALHLSACAKARLAVNILLHEKRVDKNVKNIEGLTPIHAAILDGDEEIIDMFIRCREVEVNASTPKGNDCWTLALLEKRYDILMKLMNRPEVNVNTYLDGKGTALAVAVLDENVDFVRKLLANKKVELRHIGPHFEDLASLAISSSSLAICTLILEKYNAMKNEASQ